MNVGVVLSMMKVAPVELPARSVTTNTYVHSSPVVYPLLMDDPLMVAESEKVIVTSQE